MTKKCPKCGKKLNTGFKCEVCDTMADKEERICICKLEGNATESVCGGSMTRQEAIEVMAKALCHRHCPEKVCTCCDEWKKYGTKEDAEVALNALLEGVKK